MKALYESLLDDFDTLAGKVDHRREVEQFLKQNVIELNKIKISSNPNKDGYYEVSSRGTITFYGRDVQKLTNGLFIWTQIKGNFDCSWNTSLETLEGGPREVGGSFNCERCEKLITLEGAPKTIGGDFKCKWCKSLLSLKGAPEIIPEDFVCNYCESLRTLKYSPKEVQGNYFCDMCGKTFTKSEVFNNSDVRGRIVV